MSVGSLGSYSVRLRHTASDSQFTPVPSDWPPPVKRRHCLCMCVCSVYRFCVRDSPTFCVHLPCLFATGTSRLCLCLCVWVYEAELDLQRKGRFSQPHIFTPVCFFYFFEALLLTESQMWVLIKQAPELLLYRPGAEQRSRGLWKRKSAIK